MPTEPSDPLFVPCGDFFDGLGRPLSCGLPAAHDGAHEAYYGERRWAVRWLPTQPITWGSYRSVR